MVSADAAVGSVTQPAWRSDGREIFYLRGSSIVAVPVKGEAGFSFGEPKTLFTVSVTTSNGDFTMSNDGQRILANELPPTDPSKVGARLIQNWVTKLSR